MTAYGVCVCVCVCVCVQAPQCRLASDCRCRRSNCFLLLRSVLAESQVHRDLLEACRPLCSRLSSIVSSAPGMNPHLPSWPSGDASTSRPSCMAVCSVWLPQAGCLPPSRTPIASAHIQMSHLLVQAAAFPAFSSRRHSIQTDRLDSRISLTCKPFQSDDRCRLLADSPDVLVHVMELLPVTLHAPHLHSHNLITPQKLRCFCTSIFEG